MDNDKNRDFEEANVKEPENGGESSTRARNRTVMLTPEITGQVRARLAQEIDEGTSDFPAFTSAASGRVEAPAATRSVSSNFQTPVSHAEPSGSSYSPISRTPAAGTDSGFAAPAARPSAPVKQAPPASNMVWSKQTPIVGFLVSFDTDVNGEIFEMRSGRLIISCEPASGGSYLVIEDPSVSPMHAILRISSIGEVQVLDQLSEFGTRIKRFGVEEEEHISGEKSTIEHGDTIKFGNRTFHVCILALNS